MTPYPPPAGLPAIKATHRWPHVMHPQHHYPARSRPPCSGGSLPPPGSPPPHVSSCLKVESIARGPSSHPTRGTQVRLPAPGQDRPHENGGGSRIIPHESTTENLDSGAGAVFHAMAVPPTLNGRLHAYKRMPQDADGGVHIPQIRGQPSSATCPPLPTAWPAMNGQDACFLRHLES